MSNGFQNPLELCLSFDGCPDTEQNNHPSSASRKCALRSLTKSGAQFPKNNYDSIKKSTRFIEPDDFKYREIGTEPSRRAAVLATFMSAKFKGKWEMSKERGWKSDDEEEEDIKIKQEEGTEAVERGTATNKMLLQDLIAKEP